MAAVVANSTEVKLDDYAAVNDQQVEGIHNDKRREPDFDVSCNEPVVSASDSIVVPGSSA